MIKSSSSSLKASIRAHPKSAHSAVKTKLFLIQNNFY